jgi:hypothetical protein
MTRPTRLLRGLLVFVGVTGLPVRPLDAQTAAAKPAPVAGDSGMFVIRHAGDTVATEQFVRSQTGLEGTLAVRNAKSTAQSYKAVVAPDASIALIEVTVREDADSGRTKGRTVQQARIIFKGDSAAVDDITNHGLQTRVFGTERGAVPYLNLSFALLEQAVRRSRAATGGGRVPLFNLGGGQTLDGKIAPLGTDSLTLAIGSVEYHLRVDGGGRLLGARIPSQNVVVDRAGS